ncbi:MAG: fused MFS/spermidine synthase [Candidatus Moraniibacteriota bacterium]|nr:MAG: fused MFS/spermidine synthase [Candidatus Moranbacteria bacterium]
MFLSVLKQYQLPLAVFFTGGAVLVVEVVATRILSPYFGNTIFTFSSVISVILAALSVGYAAGGRLSDRYPSERLFAAIIAASGLCIYVVYWLVVLVLPSAAYTLDVVSGPLIASLALFFLPACLLGLLSPFAITLQSRSFPQQGIGAVSGSIFFWSTAGSIVGSLGTGFFLIPHFGVSAILMGIAGLLLILGLSLFLAAGVRKAIIVGTVMACIGGVVSAPVEPVGLAVYSQDTQYQRVDVVDGLYDDQPTRFFLQDHAPSGAMFLDSDEFVLEIAKYTALYRVLHPDVRQALIIGGGAYNIPKKLLNDIPNIQVDVAEIDPALLPIAQRYFGLTADSRLTNHIADGRRFLHDTSRTYDLIYSDVYYSLFLLPHLATAEFFLAAKEKLSTDGLFLGNFIGELSSDGTTSLLLSEMRTFQEVFPNSYFFLTEPAHPTEAQNIVFLGYNSPQSIDFQSVVFTEHADPLLRSLGAKRIDTTPLHLARFPKMTDDYAPVEYLIGRLVASAPGARPIQLPQAQQ